MHEQVARVMYYFDIHLLFASLVACAAWTLTASLRASATAKYWIWVATLLNFALPVGALIDKLLASHLHWAKPLGLIGDAAYRITQPGPTATLLGLVWLVGAGAMLARLTFRLRRDVRAMTHDSALDREPGFLMHGIPVRFAGSQQAPAVDGVLRPHILLPTGIEGLLSRPELNAVLMHEVTHARRRDNLIRLIHEAALCILWFHPLVWFAGARLALYRELSCDDSVIQNARGADLISALAKLAAPAHQFTLQASASSFLSRRVARLAGPPQKDFRLAGAILCAVFAACLLGGVLETVAHTACCFVLHARTS
ncbi:MAG TPA: M56 family metallopeptidase [Steroidobacteraceae bacterium]|jgi:beta-lactamase regulating signal transducer with metallopeptidase domain|nr:M56 family metallopeptidase [Steroidobacteraceae bacterium]